MKTKNIFLTLALVLSTTFTFAQLSGASPHNFLIGGSGTSGSLFSTEICNVCHIPHNALATNALPLWNHDASSTSPFQMYTSSTMDAAYGSGASTTMVSGTSKLCLGCHDGASNMDAFGGSAGLTANKMGAAVAGNFGTDLTNDHPISIVYDGAKAKLNPDNSTTALLGTLKNDLLLGGTTVECASCHSLHTPVASTKLLRITTAGSALCLECHAK